LGLGRVGWASWHLARWLPGVWPANHEALYRIVTRRLWIQGRDTEDRELDWMLSMLLTDEREPVGSEAALAIGMALGAEDIRLRGLAAEIVIETIANRRLDGAALGETLARILLEQTAPDGREWGGWAVPERWTEPLADVSRSSPLGAHDVQNAIESIFAGAQPEHRRRLSGSLHLPRTLALDADAAVTNAQARLYLAGYSARTAGGKAAREILGVRGDGGRRSRAAVEELKRHRAL